MNHNGSTNNLHKRRVNVVSEYSPEARDSPTSVPKSSGKSLGAKLDVIYRYSRAYTLKGTSYTDFTPSFFLGVLQ
nr:homogentisate phytyltransferase 1, chloroplastic-like [Tanacetum cinerariifolium]